MATIDPVTGLPSSNVQTIYPGDKLVSSSPAPIPTISATKIGTTTATPVPTPAQPMANYTQIAQQAISGIQGSTEQALAQEAQQAQMEADRQKALISSQMSDYGQAQSALGGKSADTVSTYASQGVNSLASQLRNINAQAQGLQNEAQAIPIANRMAYKGSAGTDNQVQNVNYDQLQQNALKALSLGQQAAIAKADYDTAKSYADQMVDAKYSQLEADLKSKETQLNWAMKMDLEPAQKKAAEAKQRQYETEKKAMEDKKAEEKVVSDLLINAAPVAPPNIINAAKAVQERGGSATEVALALGQYGKDYLKNELLKEQLKTEKAQQSNYYASANKNNAETARTKAETGAITTTSGVSLKPLTEVQAKDMLYAQRGEQSSSLIDGLESKITSMKAGEFAAGKLLEANVLTSGKVSPEIRQIAQAERNFATAVLRKESGAAISPSEFTTVEKQYFPRPGDDPKTLAQKRQNRETYISSTKAGVPGYDSRVSTPEGSYLDGALKALDVVEAKTTPTSMYTSRLLNLKP